MKNNFTLIAAIALFCSCSSTELVHISVQEPAPVTIPNEIKVVGVVNRTTPSKQTKIINAVDKIFSLEGVKLDQAGAQATITGLTDELSKNTRFTQVKPLNNVQLTSVGGGFFPGAMSWEQVEQICKENNVEAIFSLEMFDTDSKLNFAAAPGAISTPLGNVPAINQQASLMTNIKTGWRIYDPMTKEILDEYPMARTLSFSESGINPARAAEMLAGRKDAVMEAGNKIGQLYAIRILPYWIRVTRDYYVRGTDQFRVARRKAQTGNWNEAAAIWEVETKNSDPKVAGRACYNMAIINEINGDLDGAIAWAQKGYENYNNRLSLHYVNILKNRKASMDLVKNQNDASQQQ
jgi:uncharacterized protein DUF6340